MFISSMIVFEAGSALCGAAPNMDALIVGRVIAGLGGTGIYIGFVHLDHYLCDLWKETDSLSPLGSSTSSL